MTQTAKREYWRIYKANQRRISTAGRLCDVCGRSGRLHRHHKDGSIWNNDPSNIALLCGVCHRAEHRVKGFSYALYTE